MAEFRGAGRLAYLLRLDPVHAWKMPENLYAGDPWQERRVALYSKCEESALAKATAVVL